MTETEYEIDETFVREARVGLGVVAVLLGIFFCVAYLKYSGWNRPQPVAFAGQPAADASPSGAAAADSPTLAPVQSLPVASLVRPGRQPPAGKSATPPLASHPGGADPRPPISIPGNAISSAAGPAPMASSLPDQLGSLTPRAPQPARLDPPRPPRDQLIATPASTSGPSITRPATTTTPSSGSAGSFSRSPVTTAQPSFWNSITRLPAIIRSPDSGQSPVANREPSIARNEFRASPATGNELRSNRPSPLKLAERLDTVVAESTGDVQRASAFQARARNASDVRSTGEISSTPRRPTSVVSKELDSFWLIAQRVYGDGRYFNALYEVNRNQISSFNEIPAGTRIATPPVKELHDCWPRLCPRENQTSQQPSSETESPDFHTTRAGETLFGIARDQLGQASRYLEILELNRDLLPADTGHETELPVNVRIRLPEQ